MANPENQTLADTIEQATVLLEEKARVAEELTQARTLARLLVGTGLGSPEQREWVNKHLPKKERSSAEDRITTLQEQLAKAQEKAASKTQ